MKSNRNAMRAMDVFFTLCREFDKVGWKYQRDEKKMTVTGKVSEHNRTLKLFLKVDAEKQLISVVIPLSFKVDKCRRDAIAIAVNAINNEIGSMKRGGYFKYDIPAGCMYFCMTSTFVGTVIKEGLFMYLLCYSSETVYKYVDSLQMLAGNAISVEEFLDETMENRRKSECGR